MDNEIKVSVCVVTYNQEKYIAECLQSLVDQETDFKFEIIVGEDCSTDKTREIVLEFQKKYPDIVKPLLHEKNVGPVENIIATYKQAKGKYIAHMDGDDLALPDKLQIQADALDQNPDCVICSHDMKQITFEGKELNRTFKVHKKIKNTIFDLYETLPFFAHSSKMFVNDLDKEFWKELHPQALDIEVHVQQAKCGNIYHIDKAYGVYRIGVGVAVKNGFISQSIIRGSERIFSNALIHNENDLIKSLYANSYLKYAYQSAVLGASNGFSIYIRKSVRIKIISILQIILWFASFSPRLCVYLAKKHANIRVLE